MQSIPLGALHRRAIAKFVDAILLGWLSLSIGLLCASIQLGPGGFDAQVNSATTSGLIADAFAIVAAPICFIGYQFLFLGLWGATPGKLLLSLQVVNEDSKRLTPAGALLRTLAEFISLLPLGAGYAAALTDVSRRTWHDRMGHTVVSSAQDRRVSLFRIAWPSRTLAAVASSLIIAAGIGIGSVGETLARWAERLRPAEERYILAGVRAGEQGDTTAALKAFNSAIEANPRSSLAYADRAGVYGEMGKFALEIEDCTKALDLDSTQVFALLNRGHVFMLLGRDADAITDYSAAIRLRPGWSGLVFAYQERGAARYRRGDLVGAAADFMEGERIGTENYLGTSDYSKGESFRTAIAMCGLLRSETLRQMGETAAADSALDVAIRQDDALKDEQNRASYIRKWLGRAETEGVAR